MAKSISPKNWIKSIVLLKKFASQKSSKSREVIVSVRASVTPPKSRDEDQLHDSDLKENGTAKGEKAAIIIQRAARGYLARRSSKTLKRIVKLQAHVRGHLVRRQAAAALRCVSAVVKFQALVRGRNVRRSDVGNALRGKINLENIKIEDSSPPLKKFSKLLIVETLSRGQRCRSRVLAGSGSEWLNRWSDSRFWSLPTADPKPKPNRELKKSSSSTDDNGSKSDGVKSEVKPLVAKGLTAKRNAVNKENNIPNYMATTTSARAKLRLQDFNDKKIVSRRHSLPCPVAGKFRVMSPKNEKRKSMGRVDKSFSFFRDGIEMIKPDWKR